MKVFSRINVYFFLTIIIILGCCATAFCQSDKDEIQYKKLEEKARKEFDSSVGKFKSGSLKKTPATEIQEKVSQTVSSYDKFKDLTTVSIVSPVYHKISAPLTGPVGKFTDQIADTDLFATYVYSGQQAVMPSQFVLTFKTFSDGAFFGNAPSFIVIADSNRFRLGEMTQTIRRFERSADEYVSIPIAYDTFLKVANADYVEVQIGNFDFPLSNGNLNALRRLAGLKDRERPSPPPIPSQNPDNSINRVANTTWINKDGVAVTFTMDGSLTSSATAHWTQDGDVIRFEFPKTGALTVRMLGIGIVRGGYMVNRFAAKGLLGTATSSETLRLQSNR